MDWQTCVPPCQQRWLLGESHAPMLCQFCLTSAGAPISPLIYLTPRHITVSFGRRGHNVMTVAPRYDAYPDTEPTGVNVPLTLPGTLAPSGMEASQPGSDKAAPPASTHATDASPHTGLRRRRRGRRRKVPEDLPASAISRNDDSAIGSAVTGDEPSTACFTEAALFSTHQCGVERVFVDHPLLRTANIYSFEAPSAGGPALTYLHGGEHSDLHIRYSILCQAALAAAALLPPVTDGSQQASEAWDTNSRAKVVFVANDWPTALVLLRLRYDLQRQPPQVTGRTELDALLARRLATAATAMCIHNLAYQGQFPASTFPALALPDRALGALCTSTPWQDVLRELTETSGAQGSGLCPCGQQPATSWYPCCEPASVDSGILTSAAPGAVPELAGACSGGELNFMRAALLACDEVVTVSPCYAEEIQTDPAMACGTQDILVAKGVT